MNAKRLSPDLRGMLGVLGWLALGLTAFAQQGGPPAGNDTLPVAQEIKPTAPTQSPPMSTEERADLFMARKDYHDALDYYQRALKESNSKEPRIWNKLGIAHSNLQQFPEARRAYREATRHKKDFAEAYNNLGTTYYLEGHPKKALKWYRHAIEHNRNNPAFHYNLGTALYATKKYKDAVASYQLVLDLDPGFFTSRSNVGTTLQARPADAKYFFYVAKVFAQKGRPEDAVRYLRRALEDGFKDFELLDGDPDFKTLAQYPPYIDLRANPPKPL